MSLRLKLILTTTAVVAVLFGVSEWLSYRQTAALLAEHEAILTETADHAVALEKLQTTRKSMFFSVTTVRILYAVGTLIIAVAILNYVWYRVIYRPIRRLLSQIDIMGRGTWKAALPIKRNDEIGELTMAFNNLGQELTSTFESINASSKLSALALIGNRLIREVVAGEAQIASSRRGLDSNTDAGVLAAKETLAAVEAQLKQVEHQFQREFDRELSSFSAQHGPVAS